MTIPRKFKSLFPIKKTGNIDNERAQINKILRKIIESLGEASVELNLEDIQEQLKELEAKITEVEVGDTAFINWGNILGDPSDQEDLTFGNLNDTTFADLADRHAAMFDGLEWVNRLLVEEDISDLQDYLVGPFSDAIHGDRGGSTLHALATPSTAGFMSGADKGKLDGLDPDASGFEFHQSEDDTLFWFEATGNLFRAFNIDPESGDEGGGTAFTLTGTNFRPADAATVTFGTEPATGVTVVDSTTITGTTPAGTGAVNVTVTQGDDSDTLLEAFNYIWTPAQIATALWLDAADESTITLDGSGNVEEWLDKSGNLRHISQATAGDRPGYLAGEYVDFASATAHLFNTSPFAYANGQIYVFDVLDVVESNDARWFAEGSSTNNNPVYNAAQCYITTATRGTAFVRNDAGTTFFAQSNYNFADFWGGRHIRSTADTGSTIQLRKNSTAGSVVSYSRSGTLTLDRFCVGALLRGALATPMNFKGHEIITLAAEPTTELREKIEGYYAHKWDGILGGTLLVDALPASHPYKDSPP